MELAPCPECYCAVEVKYMSLHLLWHGGGEEEEEAPYYPDRQEHTL